MKKGRNGPGMLAMLLSARMRTDGISMTELASRLQVSQSYLSQLVSSDKRFETANDALLRNCANYLKIPATVCFLMSGKLKAQDFYEIETDFERNLASALQVVSASRVAQETTVSLEQLGELTTELKHFVVLLYEAANDVTLIPRRLRRQTLETVMESRVTFEVRHRRL